MMGQARKKARDEKHQYGQHYTPPEVARMLAAFAVRTASDLVFDPSCGDGRLLAEALTLKRKLSSTTQRGSPAREVFGVDRSSSAIRLAARTYTQVAVADYFDVAPGQALNERVTLPVEFDAIIGNPPYIRQELIGPAGKRRIERRLALDRVLARDAYWPQWSRRSDIYVYFFAHSLSFLKQRGRLVFLTASSWLDVGYGAALREFLLNNFRVVAIIESAAESFFTDASINTSVTVLERESDATARESNLVRFVRINTPLNQILGGAVFSGNGKPQDERSGPVAQADGAVGFAKMIESARSSSRNSGYRIRAIAQPEVMAACKGGPPWPPLVDKSDRRPQRGGHRGTPVQAFNGGWGKHLRAEEVFFRIIEKGSARMRQLAELARVRFGVKTGANEFFYVPEQSAADGTLRALTEVASVRRGLTTGANDFFYVTRNGRHNSSRSTAIIEPRFLSPIIFSLKEIPGIVIERASVKKSFFNCQAAKHELRGTSALRYIEHGERSGFHKRPTCASREPWYAVTRGMKPAPLIFPSKVGERWVVALNRAGVFEDKKLYGIFPAAGVSEMVLAALLNSTWARYYAEITCRQMTGAQAIADIDVAVAEQILIPDPRHLSGPMKKKLEAALLRLARRPANSVLGEVNFKDRRKLDVLTLEAIGFHESSERQSVLDELYEAVTRLVLARLSRSAKR